MGTAGPADVLAGRPGWPAVAATAIIVRARALLRTSEIEIASGSPAPVRVLHVTDPHLFADQSADLRGTVTYSSLQKVLTHIAAAGWPADLVALTGDLVQDDRRAAYDHIVELFGTLGLPTLVVPGNHDVRPLMQEVLAAPQFDYCGSIVADDWQIIGVDSCVDDTAGGHVAADEMERLRTEIAAAPAAHVLVCLHHPPVPVGSRWLDAVGLGNRDAFLDALAESGKVRGAIFGHVHQALEITHKRIEIIGTPSTCRQFKAGSDEFAVDDNPPAYRRIELHSDGALRSELIWVNGGERL